MRALEGAGRARGRVKSSEGRLCPAAPVLVQYFIGHDSGCDGSIEAVRFPQHRNLDEEIALFLIGRWQALRLIADAQEGGALIARFLIILNGVQGGAGELART